MTIDTCGNTCSVFEKDDPEAAVKMWVGYWERKESGSVAWKGSSRWVLRLRSAALSLKRKAQMSRVIL